MNRALRAALGCPTQDCLRPAQSREGRGHGHRGSCALLAAWQRCGRSTAGDGRRSGLVRCRSERRLIAFGPVDTLLGHAIDHPSAGSRTLTQSRSWWGCGRPVGLCSVIPPAARRPAVFTRALEHLLGPCAGDCEGCRRRRGGAQCHGFDAQRRSLRFAGTRVGRRWARDLTWWPEPVDSACWFLSMSWGAGRYGGCL